MFVISYVNNIFLLFIFIGRIFEILKESSNLMLIILCIKDIKMLLFEFGISVMNKYI